MPSLTRWTTYLSSQINLGGIMNISFESYSLLLFQAIIYFFLPVITFTCFWHMHKFLAKVAEVILPESKWQRILYYIAHIGEGIILTLCAMKLSPIWILVPVIYIISIAEYYFNRLLKIKMNNDHNYRLGYRIFFLFWGFATALPFIIS